MDARVVSFLRSVTFLGIYKIRRPALIKISGIGGIFGFWPFIKRELEERDWGSGKFWGLFGEKGRVMMRWRLGGVFKEGSVFIGFGGFECWDFIGY